MQTIIINTQTEAEEFFINMFEKFLEKINQRKQKNSQFMPDDILTKREVLNYTKFKDTWFYQSIKNGKLEARKLNGEWRVKFADLQQLLNSDNV